MKKTSVTIVITRKNLKHSAISSPVALLFWWLTPSNWRWIEVTLKGNEILYFNARSKTDEGESNGSLPA